MVRAGAGHLDRRPSQLRGPEGAPVADVIRHLSAEEQYLYPAVRAVLPDGDRFAEAELATDAAIGQHCCATFRPLDEAGAPLYGTSCPGRTGHALEVLVQLALAGSSAGSSGGSSTGSGDPPSVWLNCAFSPMSDGGYVVVARDVTARKQIDDEKADFLATVSHELRTPLTPIKGFLQTLARRDGEFTEDERRHVYEVMLREGPP